MARFVEAFNRSFSRRVSATPDIKRPFAQRLEDGYSSDTLACVPILWAGDGLDRDIRKRLKVGWLLRNGSGHYVGPDGSTRQTKNWIGDALQSADQAVLPPRLREVAQAVGVLDTIHELGARFADE